MNREGVKEHCQFLKQVEDAASLRKAISYCFERANVPGLSEEERQSALSFVIVGAGPTGETWAVLWDGCHMSVYMLRLLYRKCFEDRTYED